jgi:metal-responsive CopG/Arc/MetJ family transcriptional regulator
MIVTFTTRIPEEDIMVKGNTRRIKELAKGLSKNRGIKTMKIHFISSI